MVSSHQARTDQRQRLADRDRARRLHDQRSDEKVRQEANAAGLPDIFAGTLTRRKGAAFASNGSDDGYSAARQAYHERKAEANANAAKVARDLGRPPPFAFNRQPDPPPRDDQQQPVSSRPCLSLAC